MATEYTNKFTLDGKLKPSRAVTPAKVAKVKELWQNGRRGNLVAAAQFTESIASSDAILNAAYLVNLQVLPQFEDTPRTWSEIASTRQVPDFNPVVLKGIFGEWQNLSRQGTVAGNGFENIAGVAPVVAEAERYPYATLGNTEAAYGRLRKHGFKVGWTWEARINDAIGFFDQIPSEMLRVALDTEEWEVYQALINGTTASQQLIGGTTYTGATVLINSSISRDAVVQAIFELSQRKINGRNIAVTGGYNLIVPLGQGPAVQFLLNQNLFATQDGAFSLNASFGEDGVSKTTIVESEWVTGTNWYILPKPGAVSRPVLELGQLRGYETPELRINNLTGDYAGGGTVSPFEGSFENDTIDLRLRYPLTGILWDASYVVWSKGTNAA